MSIDASAALPEGSYSQTAFVVGNLETAAAHWTKLTGAGPWYLVEPETKNTLYRGEPSDNNYRLLLGFLGGSCLELIQSLDDKPSIFKEILDMRGEGFHHVCPQMSALSGDSFDDRCHDFEQRGLQLAMTNDVVGLGRAAFYDALNTIGGFIEVFELGGAYSMVPLMAVTHLGWDGADPIREVASLYKS